MKNRLSFATKFYTIFLVCIFSFFAIFFTIEFEEYFNSNLCAAGIQAIPSCLIYISSALLCLPCVFALILAIELSNAVKSNKVFTPKTARILSCISLILFIDCMVFMCGIVFMLCYAKETLISSVLAIIDIVGISISVLLHVLSKYIRSASVLQEEVDHTL